MKGKLVTMAVSFLLCVGMVGAGFASWVITSKTQETATGNIQVDDVVDKRIKIADKDFTGVNVYFGAPSETMENAWLLNDNMAKEDLVSSASLTLDANNLLYLAGKSVTKLTFTATIAVANNDAYTAAITAKYITAPTVTTVTKEVVLSGDGSIIAGDNIAAENLVLDFVFNFGWGDAFKIAEDDETFKNVNPYTYFNSAFEDGSDTKEGLPSGCPTAADYALQVLTAIYGIKDLGITITIVGTIS